MSLSSGHHAELLEFNLSGLVPSLFKHPISVCMRRPGNSSPVMTDGIIGIGPDALNLTAQITQHDLHPSANAYGGYTNVWDGVLRTERESRKVAIKSFRGRIANSEVEKRVEKQLDLEIRVWHKLRHENVLPLLGIASGFGHYIATVSPWMENGSLTEFLKREHQPTLNNLDRLRLVYEVAAGLSYLHSSSVVHGDLTGSNVLIDELGHARLSDFGLVNVTAVFQGISYIETTISSAVRWTAPEIYLSPEDQPASKVSTKTDVYSFASVMLQIITGNIPYHYLKTEAQVLLQVCGGVKPLRLRSGEVADQYWNLISRCWSDIPDSRPNIQDIFSEVDMVYRRCKKDARRLARDNCLTEAADERWHDLYPTVIDTQSKSWIRKATPRLFRRLRRLAK